MTPPEPAPSVGPDADFAILRQCLTALACYEDGFRGLLANGENRPAAKEAADLVLELRTAATDAISRLESFIAATKRTTP